MGNNNKRNGRTYYRELNKKEKARAAEILQSDPIATDSVVARMMHEEGFANDLSSKVLRNKIRYYRNEVIPADKQETKVNKREVKKSATASGEIIMEEKATMYSRRPKHKSEQEYLDEAGLDSSLFKVSSVKVTTTETETEMGSASSTISSVGFTRRNPRRDVDVQGWFIRSTKEQLLNRVNGDADVAKKLVDAFGSEEAALNAISTQLEFSPLVKQRKQGDYSVIIPLTDMHFGEAHPVNMAKSYKKTFEHLIFPKIWDSYFGTRANVRTIDFVLMGDFVHCDNKMGTTAAGTGVAGVGSIYPAMDVASNFLIWLVTFARETFRVPVRVIYVYGNHDTTTGFGVLRTAQAALRQVKGITFMTNEKLLPLDMEFDEEIDVHTHWSRRSDRNPEYMWVKYGNLGVTYCHGKFGKKNSVNVPFIANPNFRNEVTRSAVIYGHLHHRDIANTAAEQDNFGLSTPNFCSDEYARSGGFYTEPEFYIFEVDHTVNRINCAKTIPSLPFDIEIEA